MNSSFNPYEEYDSTNPSFNEYVTEFCHGNGIHITKSLCKFLKIAYEINVIGHRTWTFFDFPDISREYYRKKIQRLAPVIEKIIDSKPCFYKLKGIHMPYYVTKKPRG